MLSAAVNQEASVELNAADAPPDSLYLTVTGTSAEAGDDGEGRPRQSDQRLDQAISPNDDGMRRRKNQVNHVGELYNFAAGLIAEELVRQAGEIKAAECYLVSQIGRPVGQPQIIDIAFGLRLAPRRWTSVAVSKKS
jgi:S-adenosylmethionine synthetase